MTDAQFQGFRSFMRGHAIQYDADTRQWFYVAADGAVGDRADDPQERACATCKRDPTPEGHDACLGTIMGAKNACCGHGDALYAYVAWEDGTETRFHDALDLFADLGIGPLGRSEDAAGDSGAVA